MSPPTQVEDDVQVTPSNVRPGCWRVRVPGNSGGQLVITREGLKALIANGQKALEEDPHL